MPYMGFGRYSVPKTVSPDIMHVITQLKAESSGAEEYLNKAYNFVLSRWHAERIKTIYYFPLAFRRDVEKIWKRSGYAHCTTMNMILTVLLVHSGYFTAEDIRIHHTFLNMFIHQYLTVRVNGVWVDADPGGAAIRHMPLGQHAWGIK